MASRINSEDSPAPSFRNIEHIQVSGHRCVGRGCQNDTQRALIGSPAIKTRFLPEPTNPGAPGVSLE
jgi:hypothetical protein